MAKRKPTNKKPVKLTVEDPKIRKAFESWIDEGIKCCENAISTLKQQLTEESSHIVRPGMQYYKNGIGVLKWVKSRMKPRV